MTTKDIINNVIDELQRALEIINGDENTRQSAIDTMLIADIETSLDRLYDLL